MYNSTESCLLVGFAVQVAKQMQDKLSLVTHMGKFVTILNVPITFPYHYFQDSSHDTMMGK